MGKKARGAEKTESVHGAYPVKTVARLTGLTPDLVRAWERRYGVVSPVRGPRGARLYASEDVARLRLLADLVARGRTIGDIARLDSQALREMALQDSPAGGTRAAADSSQPVIERVLVALKAYDLIEVERVLSESLLALGASSFANRVGVPLLEKIGELWRAGDLSPAEEHVVSATLRSIFGGLMRLQALQRSPSVLLTTPKGERHELGLSIVALLCLQAGLAVAYVGVDLPAENIVSATRRSGVRVLGLSVVSDDNHDGALGQLRLIEKSLPPEVEIWLGGRDAARVRRDLGKSRAIVLQSSAAVEAEVRRVAGTEGV